MRARVPLQLQHTHGNRYVQRVIQRQTPPGPAASAAPAGQPAASGASAAQAGDPVTWQNARLGRMVNDPTQSADDVATFFAHEGQGAFDAVRELQDARTIYLLQFAVYQDPRDRGRNQRCDDV